MLRTKLVAINSQYVHSNLAIRALKAQLPQREVSWMEANINQQQAWILQELLQGDPQVLCFSCYLWNMQTVLRLCEDVRAIRPDIRLILGGPEVSFEAKAWLAAHPHADILICGEGEERLPQVLCALSDGRPLAGLPGVVYRTPGGCIEGDQTPQIVEGFAELPFVYADPTLLPDKRQIVYYESSRGCPFGCAYCLSGSGGRRVRFRSVARVQQELAALSRYGVKLVKFVDRTFNADPARAAQILAFAMEHTGEMCIHLEIGADLLDAQTIALLQCAPKGKFQLEAGVQSCNPKTLQSVVRKTDLHALSRNVRAVCSARNVHVHLDLIAGLPFEDLASFARSFDTVYAMQPHQLQLGFLKVLRGSPLWGQVRQYGLQFRSYPPYEVLHTPWLPHQAVLRLKCVEEAVERYYNNARARRSLNLLLHERFDSPFALFDALAQFLMQTGQLTRPQSAAHQLTALCAFAQNALPQAGYDRFLALCLLDYMQCGIKGEWPEPFASRFSQRRARLCARRAMEQGWMTHAQFVRNAFCLLPLHPQTGEPMQVLCMVEPSRDVVTGQADVTVWPWPEEGNGV